MASHEINQSLMNLRQFELVLENLSWMVVSENKAASSETIFGAINCIIINVTSSLTYLYKNHNLRL